MGYSKREKSTGESKTPSTGGGVGDLDLGRGR